MTKFENNSAIWNDALRIGIDKTVLQDNGNMEILLAGETLPPMLHRIQTGNSIIWIEASIRLAHNEEGEIIVELIGINNE